MKGSGMLLLLLPSQTSQSYSEVAERVRDEQWIWVWDLLSASSRWCKKPPRLRPSHPLLGIPQEWMILSGTRTIKVTEHMLDPDSLAQWTMEAESTVLHHDLLCPPKIPKTNLHRLEEEQSPGVVLWRLFIYMPGRFYTMVYVSPGHSDSWQGYFCRTSWLKPSL